MLSQQACHSWDEPLLWEAQVGAGGPTASKGPHPQGHSSAQPGSGPSFPEQAAALLTLCLPEQAELRALGGGPGHTLTL